MTERDHLGRIVRNAWVGWAKTQPDPRPSWLVSYEGLSEDDKEADRQIGEAVAASLQVDQIQHRANQHLATIERMAAEADRLRSLNAELVASRAELEQCGKDDDETIRGLIESQNRVAEVVAKQRAEIDHLRALNAELVAVVEGLLSRIAVGPDDDATIRIISDIYTRHAIERAEAALTLANKADSKPTGR